MPTAPCSACCSSSSTLTSSPSSLFICTHTVGYPSAGAEFPTSAPFSSLFRRLRALLSSHSHSSLLSSSRRRRSWYPSQSLRNCCRPAPSSKPAYLLLVARWDFSSRKSGFQLSSLCRGREESAIVLPVVTGSGEVVVLGVLGLSVGDGGDDVGAPSTPAAMARSAARVGESSMPSSHSCVQSRAVGDVVVLAGPLYVCGEKVE